MSMSHRERLEAAWRHEEPDRVPIELLVAEPASAHPAGGRLNALIEEHADNFAGAGGPQFGFLGFPASGAETVIEDRPGEYRRVERVQETPAGVFTAITYHPAGDTNDCHWEKRYIATLDDLARLAETPRQPAAWDAAAYAQTVAKIGDSAFPVVGLFHGLGRLVRSATMDDMYAWFYEEPALVHRFQEAVTAQVVATVERMTPPPGQNLCFGLCAHEMLIPPWMGHRLFDEFVLPYDRQVCRAIRERGGTIRAHCHGNCLDFLEKFADIGIGAIEPLEGPPYGNIDLAEAKRRVRGRMLLSGNIASQEFVRLTPEDVRQQVRDAIRAAAPGGGFSLRTTGGRAGTQVAMPDEAMRRVIQNCEAYILAGLEYGQYPIRG